MKVAEEAYEQNTASTYPEPEDKEAFIRTHLYDYNYDKVVSFIFQILSSSHYQSKINLAQISPFLAWLGKVLIHKFTNKTKLCNAFTWSIMSLQYPTKNGTYKLQHFFYNMF